MRIDRWTRLVVGLGAGALLWIAAAAVRADDAAEGRGITIQLQDANDKPSPTTNSIQPTSKYWLGVGCEPAGESLRAQLDLPKDQGLVVLQVIPDGPAAKAELKPYDVLLTAGDKKLSAVSDLADVVGASKGETVKLKVLRRGKPIEIAVQPARRPENKEPLAAQFPFPGGDREAIERALKQFGMTLGDPSGKNMIFVHPGAGMLLPPGAGVRPELPDDMSVDIHREGKKPAEVTVHQGKQTWKVSENELSKLPEEVRRVVEPLMLAGSAGVFGESLHVDGAPRADGKSASRDRKAAAPDSSDAGKHQEDRRIEELSRRLEQMRQEIDQLRSHP